MNRDAMRHYMQHYMQRTVPLYDFAYFRIRWNEAGKR